jgi:hypothetical protein
VSSGVSQGVKEYASNTDGLVAPTASFHADGGEVVFVDVVVEDSWGEFAQGGVIGKWELGRNWVG